MANERILVVDDEPAARRAVAKNLSSFGYVVETAVDGLTSLDNLNQCTPLDGAVQPQKRTAPKSELRSTDGIVGTSLEILEVLRQVAQVAASRATVLLTGESGTGKELVAAAIHNRSQRATRPFVRVHCAALSEGLLESELFGHERGSFTGALRQRCGRFEQANGGTLLLDEIGEVSPANQVKLLRVLQERAFERVGGNETVRVDVRLIAATNRDLKDMVTQGTFRADLYYRINVINLRLPALRERPSDIPCLIEHFLALFARENEESCRGLSNEAFENLVRYQWPGNVRELENVVQRAVVLAGGEVIETRHMPREVADGPRAEVLPAIPGSTMLDFERYAILRTLQATGGSTKQAAAALGISIRTIQYRLLEYKRKYGSNALGASVASTKYHER